MKQTRSQELPDVGLVIAAAGTGTRFGSPQDNKLLLTLRGMPVFLHTLTRFLTVIDPDNTVLVVRKDDEALFREALSRAGLPASLPLVHGADTRQDSVIAGLRALPPNLPLVAVQDAARPLTTIRTLLDCVESARTHGTGIAARPVTDTVKLADENHVVVKTLPRQNLWAAETPQVIAKTLLEKAYDYVTHSGKTVTDEAQAVEAYGRSARLVTVRTPNPKVTYAFDLRLVDALTGTP